MKTKTKGFLLMASIVLATTFTLSCSGDDGEGNGGSSSSGGTQGGGSSSSDGGGGGNSSSSVCVAGNTEVTSITITGVPSGYSDAEITIADGYGCNRSKSSEEDITISNGNATGDLEYRGSGNFVIMFILYNASDEEPTERVFIYTGGQTLEQLNIVPCTTSDRLLTERAPRYNASGSNPSINFNQFKEYHGVEVCPGTYHN